MTQGKTLYISDLDGTLLNKDAELSAHTRKALEAMAAKNVCFSVATARTAASAFKILEGLPWRVPLVLMSGVLVYDAVQRRYVQVLPLAAHAVRAITAALRRLRMTGIMYQLKDGEQVTYCERAECKPLQEFMQQRILRYGKVFHKLASFADVAPEDIIYFTLLDAQNNIQRAHDALAGIPGITLSMYADIYSAQWHLEVHSSAASKRSGAEYLRETCGFARIVGFGDNLNDLPLFEACDVAVAVGNAKDEVKAAADFICDTNENDGVVRWIEQDILRPAGRP